MPNLIQLYQTACDEKRIQFNEQQFLLVEQLQTLLTQIECMRWYERWNFFRSHFRKKRNAQGVYVYGGVGTGKTFLMDLFFSAILKSSKIRLHFFEFMQFIHQEMALHQGRKNPLKWISKQLKKRCDVLLLDEFFVKDIVDAMLFRRLFESLFDEGMVIVITSNLAPQELYQRGLQRELFLPAIDLIQEKMTVFHLTVRHDYRKTKEKSNESYFFLAGIQEAVQQKMNAIFMKYSDPERISTDPIRVSGRLIPCVLESNAAAWFDFIELCGKARSASDYLVLAKRYRVFLISNLKKAYFRDKNTIFRFIQLVDVLYEAHAILSIESDSEWVDLCPKDHYAFDFLRTESRLFEMNSKSWRAFLSPI